jgi:hypothetical protein
MNKMKRNIFAFFLIFIIFFNACGISPKQGSPTISNNEILIEIDTFNIWKNVDGDIIELNWTQLLGSIDNEFNFSMIL